MGMRMPETRWAVFKRQVINLRICCFWLVDAVVSTMMHGLANPKITLVIKFRRMRWAGHAARMREWEVHTGFSARGHLEDVGEERKIILIRIFKKWDGKAWELEWSGSGQVQLAGDCEYGNEPSGSIKCGKFTDWRPHKYSGRTFLQLVNY